MHAAASNSSILCSQQPAAQCSLVQRVAWSSCLHTPQLTVWHTWAAAATEQLCCRPWLLLGCRRCPAASHSLALCTAMCSESPTLPPCVSFTAHLDFGLVAGSVWPCSLACSHARIGLQGSVAQYGGVGHGTGHDELSSTGPQPVERATLRPSLPCAARLPPGFAWLWPHHTPQFCPRRN